jgi:hypothetical protein
VRLCLAFLLLAIAASARADKINFDAYSVYSPLGAGWMVTRGGVYDVAFGAALTRTHTWAMTAAAVPFRLDSLEQVREAFIRNSDPLRFRITQAGSERVRLNGADCVRLSIKAEEAETFVIEATQVTCLHPSAPGLAIEIGYHERYLPGEDRGRFKEAGERFIRSAKFWRPVPRQVTSAR